MGFSHPGKTGTEKRNTTMAKKAKKAVKKAAKNSSTDHAARREKIIKMLMRKTGCTQAEMIEAGHAQPAQAALKFAETRGLKTSSEKPEGDVTHYYASGTLLPAGTRKPAKKAAAKKAVKKTAKKAAAKKAKKPRKSTPAAEASAAA